MPTVNAGSSVTLTLSATDAYTVSTAGEAYVDLLAGAPGSPSESPRIVNGSLRFGPYGVAAQIRVRAVSGATDYATYAVKGPVLATAAEAAAFQSMVSGAGNPRPLSATAALARNYKISHGEPWADFVSASWAFVASGAGGGTWDTSAPYNARAAILQPAASAGSNSRITLSSTSFTVQSTDIFVVLIDQITGVSNSDQFRLAFSSDNNSTKSASAIHVSKLAHGNKAYFVVRASDLTLSGGELLTNTFNYIEVRYISSAGGGSVRVLGVLKNAKARPKLLIDFDDEWDSAWRYAMPIMAKYGLLGSMGVIAGRVGTAGFMTLAQLQEMYALGWDMTVHGETPHSSLGSRAILLADVIANRDYVINQGWSRNNGYKHYVYPGGVVSTANDSFGVLAEAGFYTGRLVDPNAHPTVPLGIDRPYGCWSRDLSDTTTVATLLADIDRAIDTGATVRIHGHKVLPATDASGIDMTVANFETLCSGISDRIRDGKIDNMTTPAWWATGGF